MSASNFFLSLTSIAVMLTPEPASATIESDRFCPKVTVCGESGCSSQPNCDALDVRDVLTIAEGTTPPPLSRAEQEMRLEMARQVLGLPSEQQTVRRRDEASVFTGTASSSCIGAVVNGVCHGSAVGANTNGIPMYRADECIGAVVNGVCHGSILPKTAVPKKCYGSVVNGQCIGPSF